MTYLDHYQAGPLPWDVSQTVVIHSWREHTRARLEWLYGPERAALIDAGKDPTTQADIAAWNRLGKRGAA